MKTFELINIDKNQTISDNELEVATLLLNQNNLMLYFILTLYF